MTATNWGVRIEKSITFKGSAIAVDRIVPWANVKFADLHPEAPKAGAK